MKIINQHVQKPSRNTQFRMVPIAIVALWAPLALAQPSARPAFQSPSEAAQSLFQAVQSNNEPAIAKILGAPTELTSSEDPGQDRVDRELFAQKYEEMHRLGREPDGSVFLYIGAENWPFPIPLVNENGAWHFDADAGQKEVLFRRIGENELAALAACREFVAAERTYRAGSNAGSAESAPASLVAQAATGTASSDPVLLDGYYFRLLPTASPKGKTPAAFALIAYPAKYRSSGVMTFFVTQNGVIFEKDLGADTATLASTMAAFHKDATWWPADEY